jgi:hypothetical protein
MASQLHVLVGADRRWIVKAPGPDISSSHASQYHAMKQARRSLRQAGGGELVLHAQEGQLPHREWVGPPRPDEPE